MCKNTHACCSVHLCIATGLAKKFFYITEKPNGTSWPIQYKLWGFPSGSVGKNLPTV